MGKLNEDGTPLGDGIINKDPKQGTLPPKKKALKKAKVKEPVKEVSAFPQSLAVLLKASQNAKFHKPGSFFYATKAVAQTLTDRSEAEPANEADVEKDVLKELKKISGIPAGAAEQEEDEEDED